MAYKRFIFVRDITLDVSIYVSDDVYDKKTWEFKRGDEHRLEVQADGDEWQALFVNGEFARIPKDAITDGPLMNKYRVVVDETRIYRCECEVEAASKEEAEQLVAGEVATYEIKSEITDVTAVTVKKVEMLS